MAGWTDGLKSPFQATLQAPPESWKSPPTRSLTPCPLRVPPGASATCTPTCAPCARAACSASVNTTPQALTAASARGASAHGPGGLAPTCHCPTALPMRVRTQSGRCTRDHPPPAHCPLGPVRPWSPLAFNLRSCGSRHAHTCTHMYSLQRCAHRNRHACTRGHTCAHTHMHTQAHPCYQAPKRQALSSRTSSTPSSCWTPELSLLSILPLASSPSCPQGRREGPEGVREEGVGSPRSGLTVKSSAIPHYQCLWGICIATCYGVPTPSALRGAPGSGSPVTPFNRGLLRGPGPCRLHGPLLSRLSLPVPEVILGVRPHTPAL